MRWILIIIGILMILMGSTFALQGANVLLGSPMTGDPFWLVVGIVLVLVGIALVISRWRRQSTPVG